MRCKKRSHPGYLSWDQYLRNQQRLQDNRTDRREDDIHLGVRWQTGAVSAHPMARRKRVDEIWRTTDDVITRMRALATHQTDRQIAAQLNVEGLTTGAGPRAPGAIEI